MRREIKAKQAIGEEKVKGEKVVSRQTSVLRRWSSDQGCFLVGIKLRRLTTDDFFDF